MIATLTLATFMALLSTPIKCTKTMLILLPGPHCMTKDTMGTADDGKVDHLTQELESPVCAGHSLGGALSDLAAYDIAKAAAAAGARLRLSCYTFGAPRVGNHAYAKDHADTCPDTWSVINDQVQNHQLQHQVTIAEVH